MIIRIVKMTFEPKKVKEFLRIFNDSKKHIRNFKGCTHLQLLYDVNDPHVFFTYSYWESEDDLEIYRDSELFKDVWDKAKALFLAQPEAWSLTQTEIMN